MPDTAESLLREHLKLCSNVRRFVPTDEEYWAGSDGEYTLARRWYYESNLKARTEILLATLAQSPQEIK